MTTSPSLLLPCPHCGATNRLPASRVDDAPDCGRCGQPLLNGQALALDDSNFDAIVTATRQPVVVDFWAAWCGPCQMMAPAFAQAAAESSGRALFVKVDTESSPQLAARFGIRSIPTLVKLQGGREVQRSSGAQPAAAIRRFAGT